MRIEKEVLEQMKSAYYEFRGWDIETGVPRAAKLRELNLDEIIPDMLTQ